MRLAMPSIIRAPPDAAITINGTRNGFAHHGAHRPADEAVFHGAHHHGMRFHLAYGAEDGVIKASVLLGLAKALLVRLDVCEVERIGRTKSAIDQFVAGL